MSQKTCQKRIFIEKLSGIEADRIVRPAFPPFFLLLNVSRLVINHRSGTMKHLYILTILSLLTLTLTLSAQMPNLLTFDSVGLPLDTFWNGQDTNLYKEGKFTLEAKYDTSFGGYWSSGIAISTMRDDSTGDFTNLHSSVTGGGHNSDAYGVVSAAQEAEIHVGQLFYWPVWMEGFVTNTTYAYTSMSEGDQFAKKFGGASGDDPDYFFIRFRFYYDSSATIEDSHFDFYLADFRFEDNAQDYIVDDWVYVDLNDYPNYEHPGYMMSMQVYSSDTGQFGINTPAYFCIDDLRWDMAGGVEDRTQETFVIQVKEDAFQVETVSRSSVRLLDMQGRMLVSSDQGTTHTLQTHSLPQGIYVVVVKEEGSTSAQKVVRW